MEDFWGWSLGGLRKFWYTYISIWMKGIIAERWTCNERYFFILSLSVLQDRNCWSIIFNKHVRKNEPAGFEPVIYSLPGCDNTTRPSLVTGIDTMNTDTNTKAHHSDIVMLNSPRRTSYFWYEWKGLLQRGEHVMKDISSYCLSLYYKIATADL